MGLTIEYPPDHAESLASNKGWSDFGKWASSIDAKTYPRIHQIWYRGITGIGSDLALELDHALSHSPPSDATVHATAENLLRVAQESGDAEYLAVTDGMGPDTGEDEVDEEAANYDPK